MPVEQSPPYKALQVTSSAAHIRREREISASSEAAAKPNIEFSGDAMDLVDVVVGGLSRLLTAIDHCPFLCLPYSRRGLSSRQRNDIALSL